MNEKCRTILEQFEITHENYEKVQEIASDAIRECLTKKDIPVCIFESRVKEVKSLEGKLERKGNKYDSIWDLTDLVGTRVVTYYTHDVDRIAAALGIIFDIDRKNSDDKRTIQTGDSFGYLSLHLICSIPESMYSDPAHPEINKIRFEIQVRTLLQHMWAATQHNTGYKTDVDIPAQYRRRYSRLAGLLEIADEEYSSLVADVEGYKKAVRKLAESDKLNDERLNRDTFDAYMSIDTDKEFLDKLAYAYNKDIVSEPYDFYYDVMRAIGIRTIQEAENIRIECENEAYRLAMMMLSESSSGTISSNIMTDTIFVVYILKKFGTEGLIEYYTYKNGTSEGAEEYANECIKMAKLANADS